MDSGCDGQGVDGTCYCDSLCNEFGDCCSDYKDVCGELNLRNCMYRLLLMHSRGVGGERESTWFKNELPLSCVDIISIRCFIS